MDKVRFSTTGLEATQHATRFARAYTKKPYVLKFEGGYHGSHDTLLVGVKPRIEVAGPPRHPNSAPASPGILPEVTGHTLVAPFNDLEATREVAREHKDDLAAIIAEPIPMNMGFILPEDGFFPGVRELCDELGALLILDEIKTGAKYPHGGAARVGVRADLITLGKSIACGVPLSAIAAGPGILDEVGPRKVAHAGTYNSNPLAMAACLASLDHILTDEALARSSTLNARLAKGYGEVFRDAGVTAHVSADGVSGTVYFTDHPVRNWRDFLTVDGDRSMLYYYLCLNRGLIPSGTGPDEQWTISVQHTDRDVDRHLEILASVAGQLAGTPQSGEIEESVQPPVPSGTLARGVGPESGAGPTGAVASSVSGEMSPTSSARWQETSRPGFPGTSRRGGGSARETSMTNGHRAANRHPGGGVTSVGISPVIR